MFKMAAAQFFDVFKEETSKMKENAGALVITWATILKHLLFSLGSVNIEYRILSIRLRDYSTIFTSLLANNC